MKSVIGRIYHTTEVDIDGLMQDCSNSIANALELMQSCTKPLIYSWSIHNDSPYGN